MDSPQVTHRDSVQRHFGHGRLNRQFGTASDFSASAVCFPSNCFQTTDSEQTLLGRRVLIEMHGPSAAPNRQALPGVAAIPRRQVSTSQSQNGRIATPIL